MEIGIRTLKTHLSKYVHQAADGEQITITDRGRPVARLTAIPTASALERGIDEGWIEPARRTRLAPIARVVARTTTHEVLDEDRG